MEQNLTKEQTYEALMNTAINLVIDKPFGKEEAAVHIRYDKQLLQREQALRLLLMLALQSSETFAQNLEDVWNLACRSELSDIVGRYERERMSRFVEEIASYMKKVLPLLVDQGDRLSATVLIDMTHLSAEGQYDTVVLASSTPDDPFTSILKAIRQNPELQGRVRELLTQTQQDNTNDFNP